MRGFLSTIGAISSEYDRMRGRRSRDWGSSWIGRMTEPSQGTSKESERSIYHIDHLSWPKGTRRLVNTWISKEIFPGEMSKRRSLWKKRPDMCSYYGGSYFSTWPTGAYYQTTWLSEPAAVFIDPRSKRQRVRVICSDISVACCVVCSYGTLEERMLCLWCPLRSIRWNVDSIRRSKYESMHRFEYA